MAVTLGDVARHAGVSESTVSRVVRGVPVVSNKARTRVERAIIALNYRPDVAARSIRTGSSHAIGFVVPDILNSFYSMVYEAAEQALHAVGYELVLATSHYERDRERTIIESLLARRIDGFILSLVDEDLADLRPMLDSIPTILIDRESNSLQADIILSDHAAGMRQAVEHLVGLGHRRLALLTGRPDLYPSRSRQTAFLRSARRLGLRKSDLLNLHGDRSVTAGEAKTKEVMLGDRPPTAIIAGSNQLLRGVLLALNELDLSCPTDVSLVTCEDSDICRIYKPSISVVRRDVDALGEWAATRLLEVLAGHMGSAEPRSPTIEIAPTEFVARCSSGPAPVVAPRKAM